MPINNKSCFLCGTTEGLELHHIFNGPNRQLADEDDLTVWLCHYHHNEPPSGVHYNRQLRDMFKALAQAKYEKSHTHKEFMARYGKNYR